MSECFDLLRHLPGFVATFLMFPYMFCPSMWRGGREGEEGMERREEEKREGTESTRLDFLVCPCLVKTLTHGLVFNPKSLFVLFDPKILLRPYMQI